MELSPHISVLGNEDNTEEDAESLIWNNTIGPLLQQLETVTAGSVAGLIRNLNNKVQTHDMHQS